MTVNGVFQSHSLINGIASIVGQTVIDITNRTCKAKDIVSFGIEGIWIMAEVGENRDQRTLSIQSKNARSNANAAFREHARMVLYKSQE